MKTLLMDWRYNIFTVSKSRSYLFVKSLWLIIVLLNLLIKADSSIIKLIVESIWSCETWLKAFFFCFVQIFLSPHLKALFWAIKNSLTLGLLGVLDVEEGWHEVFGGTDIEDVRFVKGVLEGLLERLGSCCSLHF